MPGSGDFQGFMPNSAVTYPCQVRAAEQENYPAAPAVRDHLPPGTAGSHK